MDLLNLLGLLDLLDLLDFLDLLDRLGLLDLLELFPGKCSILRAPPGYPEMIQQDHQLQLHSTKGKTGAPAEFGTFDMDLKDGKKDFSY